MLPPRGNLVNQQSADGHLRSLLQVLAGGRAIRYGTWMRLDVYPTDAEAFEATAALVVERLRAAGGSDPLTVALSGGRGGRGVMLALAARSDPPWTRIAWYWGDERCVPADDPQSNVRLARESLLVPRGIAARMIHPPPVELGEPDRIAAGYAGTLAAALGDPPIFDLILLGVGDDGHIASLTPGCRALRAVEAVAPVARDEVGTSPHVARITVTPPVLAVARHIVVTATGDAKAQAVAKALREPADPARVPAQLVRPSDRVSWIVDRAAAEVLLRDAQAVPDEARHS
jgi:6-phosphogluconolactonase